MPIETRIAIPVLSVKEFKAVDYRVMKHAFDSQNELGQLCEEKIFETDLAARLRADGFRRVFTQVQIGVSHREFLKSYFVDLIVDGALYELKTMPVLVSKHKAQLLHYVLMLGLRCGKLLNFGPERVVGQMVIAGMTPDERWNFRLDTTRWCPMSENCERLKTVMKELLTDWGAFLEVALYQAALTFFLGGVENVMRQVPLIRNNVPLGLQCMHLHCRDIGFTVTALTDNFDAHERKLRKFLQFVNLAGLQWINLNHTTVQFITVAKNR